jgi:hypothetical protein
VTSTGAHPFRRSRIVGVVVVGAIVLGILAIVLVRGASEPDTLAEKVADAMKKESPRDNCLGGEPSREPVRSSQRPDIYPDLIRQARSAVLVSCNDVGPVTVVVEFDTRAALERSFTRSRSARHSAWCLVAAGAFDGKTLDHPGDLDRLCRRVDGTIRRAR